MAAVASWRAAGKGARKTKLAGRTYLARFVVFGRRLCQLPPSPSCHASVPAAPRVLALGVEEDEGGARRGALSF